jgi:hypothetical protein
MTLVICDLAFFNVHSSKISYEKSENNNIPGKIISLNVLLQDFPPKMMPFLLIIERVPKIQKSRSYETWAMEILPP